jgi:hypothetical protein
MKTVALRLVTFFVFSLVAAGMSAQDDGGVLNRDFNLGGGGGSGCANCQGGMSGGAVYVYCGSPDSGDSGRQYCRIESYPEGSYCILDGSDGCVD